MKIRIENDRFIDENGNQILFNGVNLVCKDKEAGYLFPDTEPVFRRFREQGFNLIRLGIFWMVLNRSRAFMIRNISEKSVKPSIWHGSTVYSHCLTCIRICFPANGEMARRPGLRLMKGHLILRTAPCGMKRICRATQ